MRSQIPKTLSPDPFQRLADIGFALCGGRWRTALPKMIEIDRTTLFRWLNQDSPLPADVNAKLAKACRQRADQMAVDAIALVRLAQYLEAGR